MQIKSNPRIPVHSDAYCACHDLVVDEYGMCIECYKVPLLELNPMLETDLPDPFDEVLGG